MPQAQTQDICQHCKKLIQAGQPICTLHKAVFHAWCLTAWCAANLKGRRNAQTT